jgi:hypothetical protein
MCGAGRISANEKIYKANEKHSPAQRDSRGAAEAGEGRLPRDEILVRQ